MKQDKLIEAAKALVARWDSPDWKDATHTADYIHALRYAVHLAELASQAQPTPSQSEPVAKVYNHDGTGGYDIEYYKKLPIPCLLYTKPQPTSQETKGE